MTAHLPALIVLMPLAVALTVPVWARLSAVLAYFMTLASLVIALISSLGSLQHVLLNGKWHYYFGGWLPPWGIEYVIDPLAGGIAVLVSFLGLLVAIYSQPYLADKPAKDKGYFYALYLLMVAGLLGIVVTGDVFNLYVFLEISSLAAYALIAFGDHRAIVAAFRYLLIGTVAASLYLLGIGYLYAVTGSLNMADLSKLLASLGDSRAVVVLAVALIVVGLGTKMALFPLHGWLPDAYSYAPAPVAPFIASVMGKVSAYALYRILYFVLKAAGPVSVALPVIGWAAALGILAGSIMAIAQKDFRRMLAYSSVAQMGYIALGMAVGNAMALMGAVFHVFAHAITKGCLFLVAGNVGWRRIIKISDLAGLSQKMPLTAATLVVAALSMVGLPPTAGFFSKWYLVLGAIEAGKWPYALILVISSLLTAVYFFRVIEYVYFEGNKEQSPTHEKHSHAESYEEGNILPRMGIELPTIMLLPVLVLGLGILALGLLNEQVIRNLIQFTLPWRIR